MLWYRLGCTGQISFELFFGIAQVVLLWVVLWNAAAFKGDTRKGCAGGSCFMHPFAIRGCMLKVLTLGTPFCCLIEAQSIGKALFFSNLA